MLKQVVYNYVDLDGTVWNTAEDGITNTESSSFIIPSDNQLNIPNGEHLKRLSLQARPGTFFEFKETRLMITNSGIFNYDGQANNLYFPEDVSWFILDYETEADD